VDFEKSLGDGIDRLDVGQRGTLKDVDVIHGAAVYVSEWKERDRDVFGRIELEVLADVGDIGAEIRVREHDALGLASCAGGVDERSKLARKNLRSAHTVRRDVRRACAGDKGFVAETFAGNVGTAVGDNNLFELRKIGTDGEKLLQLGHANDETTLAPQ